MVRYLLSVFLVIVSVDNGTPRRHAVVNAAVMVIVLEVVMLVLFWIGVGMIVLLVAAILRRINILIRTV